MTELVKQNLVVDEGVDQYGTRHALHLTNDKVVHQRTFDAQPFIDGAAADRAATAGQRWGDMRKVATLPMALYAQVLAMPTQEGRQKKLKQIIQENPAFCTFDRYLKT